MPTRISPDYKPSDRCIELLAMRYGLTTERAKEFIGHEFGAFMMYWEGTGKTKANWDSTCLNWMTRTYDDKKEAIDRNHRRSQPQGNIFDQALSHVRGETEEKPKRPTHRFIPQPKSTERMSTDDALVELRKITGVTI